MKERKKTGAFSRISGALWFKVPSLKVLYPFLFESFAFDLLLLSITVQQPTLILHILPSIPPSHSPAADIINKQDYHNLAYLVKIGIQSVVQ